MTTKNQQQTAAQLLIRSLVLRTVEHIFGIPGGKIMPTFGVLNDEGPDLIVCRHERKHSSYGRRRWTLTGTPEVCLVTSGPGTGNLVTGFASQERSRAANTRAGSTTSTIKATIAGWKGGDHENVKQSTRNPRG